MTNQPVIERPRQVEARQRADRIRAGIEAVAQLQTDVVAAFEARDWHYLGYSSWDQYCQEEFDTSQIRLPRGDRQGFVAYLREHGMSTRAISSATGADRKTVRRDIEQVGEKGPPVAEVFDAEIVDEPKQITGTDGKSYSAAQTSPVQNRPSLPKHAGAVAIELSKVVRRFEKVRTDDRYRVNKTSIADECVPDIRRAIEVLQHLLDDLGED